MMTRIIREYFYGQSMHELSAHQLSTLIGLILFGVYIRLLNGLCQIESKKQALLIGAIWLVLTIVFEFFFGHYVIGNAWSSLFYDYNLAKGRVWLLVLIWISIAPYIFYRLRQ